MGWKKFAFPEWNLRFSSKAFLRDISVNFPLRKKVFVFEVILVRIFPHPDWIRRDICSPYSVQMRENFYAVFINQDLKRHKKYAFFRSIIQCPVDGFQINIDSVSRLFAFRFYKFLLVMWPSFYRYAKQNKRK